MSDIEPRRRGGMSRRAREKRAYQLVLATGGFAVLTAVFFVLAVLGILSGSPAVLAAVAAVGSGLLLRRTLKP